MTPPPDSPGTPTAPAASPAPQGATASADRAGEPRRADPATRDTNGGGMSARWNVAAAFAGWLLPGLGHFLLGQSRRAVVLGTTIGTLWLGGLLIGGVSVIDHDDHPAWFLGQVLVAPSWAADVYRLSLVSEHDGGFAPEDDPPFEPAYGRAHEQGTLFTSLAGLLNLLAIIDVLYRDPSEDPRPAARAVST